MDYLPGWKKVLCICYDTLNKKAENLYVQIEE